MRPSRRATDRTTPDLTRRRLTPREQDIALLVADGLASAVIALRLGLSPNTVRNYITHIRLRLALGSREDLAGWVNARRDPADRSPRLRRTGADTAV